MTHLITSKLIDHFRCPALGVPWTSRLKRLDDKKINYFAAFCFLLCLKYRNKLSPCFPTRRCLGQRFSVVTIDESVIFWKPKLSPLIVGRSAWFIAIDGIQVLVPPNRHFIRAPKALLKSRRISSIFIVELQRWLNDRHEKVSSRGSSAQSCLMFNDCYLKTLESFGSMRDGAERVKGSVPSERTRISDISETGPKF